MNDEIIKVRNTDSGDLMDVVVYKMRPDCIEVVIGKGQHSVTCELKPTRTRQAYSGSVMGRELVYERSCEEVEAEFNAAQPRIKPSRPSR
jgi:hypothetical protein